VSHQRQRRSQAVRRTNTHGRPRRSTRPGSSGRSR
jgi:hypothetical protein